MFKYVGLRHILEKPLRAILSIIGVACGVALFLAIQIINRSTVDTFRNNVEAVTGKANLVITAGPSGFPEEKAEILSGISGIKEAAPLVEVRAYLAKRGRSVESLIILGIDLLKEKSIRTYKTTDEEVIEDPLSFLNQPDSIIVTKEFAAKHGLEIGSPLEVASQDGKRALTVRGLLTPEGPAKAYGGALAIMDIDGARFTFGKEGKFNRIDLLVEEDKLPSIQADLIQKLGAGFRVEPPQAHAEGVGSIIKTYQVMLSFFSTLALFVGIFMVANSASISVAERRREIGILRAVGALKPNILWVFLAENAVLGLVGSVAGVYAGRTLSYSLVDQVTKSMSMQSMSSIQVTKLIFSPWDFVAGMAIGVTAAIVGSLLPSLTATSVNPLEAMKRTEVGTATGRSRLGIWGVYAGLLGWAYLLTSAYFGFGHVSKGFDYASQFSGMFGAAMVGPFLVSLGLVVFGRYLKFPSRLAPFRMAQENLVRDPERTGKSTASLIVALVLVIMVATLQFSFDRYIMGWINRVLHSDLFISSTGSLSSYQVQQLKESIGEDLAKVPGVKLKDGKGAYALRFVQVDYEGRQIGLKAYDEPTLDLEYKVFDVRDGDRVETAKKLYSSPDPVVLVSENFVVNFGPKKGDYITLNTPTGAKSFLIVGVVRDFASSQGVVYLDRRKYKEIFKDDLVDGFGLMVAPGFTSGQVRDEIDRRLGQSKNLNVLLNSELKNEVRANITESFAYTRAIELAALLVGMLGLINTFIISVMERTREMGVMRAIGMTRFQLVLMVISEAVFQGAAGAVMAIGIGAALAYIWISTSLSVVLGWVIEFSFPWISIFQTFAIGVGVAAIAGLWPAWKASRLEVKEALEYE